MRYDSPYWNLELGMCEKHGLPSVPCPSCMADPIDKDVIRLFDPWDDFDDPSLIYEPENASD